MPASTRILVVDSDATSQGDLQEILVSRRFVALGGTDLGEETVTMARAFQPQVILLNLDNGQESYRVAESVASEFPEAHLIAFTRRKDTDSAEQSARVCFDGYALKVAPADERALVAAIESALTGPEEEMPEEQVPFAADDGHNEMRPSPLVDSPSPVAGRGRRVAPSPSGQSAEPFLRHFAETASEWLLTRSLRAEERLLATVAEDVQAPSFGGSGHDAVRRGLEGLAWRLGRDFRLVPSDLGGEPVLAVMVATRDGHWHRAGHFVVQSAGGSRVSYIDYCEDEPSEKPDPEAY
jgi:DNA-binding NarL/FixJ family response regulator